MGDPSEAPCVAEWLWLSPRAVPGAIGGGTRQRPCVESGCWQEAEGGGEPCWCGRGVTPALAHQRLCRRVGAVVGLCPVPSAGWPRSTPPCSPHRSPDRWALPCGRGAVLPGRAGEMAFCRSLERVPASISWQGAEPRQRSIRAVISRAPERSVRLGGESSPPSSTAAPSCWGGSPVTAVLCFGSCREHACHPEHVQTPVCLGFPDRQPGRRLFPAGPRAWRWSRRGERLVHPDVCLESNLEPLPWPGTPHSCPER